MSDDRPAFPPTPDGVTATQPGWFADAVNSLSVYGRMLQNAMMLDESYIALLRLRYENNLIPMQIARFLDIPCATVTQQLDNARFLLRNGITAGCHDIPKRQKLRIEAALIRQLLTDMGRSSDSLSDRADG